VINTYVSVLFLRVLTVKCVNYVHVFLVAQNRLFLSISSRHDWLNSSYICMNSS